MNKISLLKIRVKLILIILNRNKMEKANIYKFNITSVIFSKIIYNR